LDPMEKVGSRPFSGPVRSFIRNIHQSNNYICTVKICLHPQDLEFIYNNEIQQIYRGKLCLPDWTFSELLQIYEMNEKSSTELKIVTKASCAYLIGWGLREELKTVSEPIPVSNTYTKRPTPLKQTHAFRSASQENSPQSPSYTEIEVQRAITEPVSQSNNTPPDPVLSKSSQLIKKPIMRTVALTTPTVWRNYPCYSLCFPSISTTAYKFEVDLAAKIACEAIKNFLSKYTDERIRIYLVDINENSEALVRFREESRKVLPPKENRFGILCADLTQLKSKHDLPCHYIVNASNPHFNEGGSGTNQAIHEACQSDKHSSKNNSPTLRRSRSRNRQSLSCRITTR